MSRASDHAYQFIRNAILSGSLAPGNQLREEDLAERCGVSRTPVREALRRLEADQLVRRTDSQRSFVSDWSLDDIEEGFQLRAMLESRAAERAALRIGPEELATLELLNDKIIVAISKDVPDTAAFADINRTYHATVVAAAQSERLARQLGGLVEQPIVLRTASRYDRNQLERSVVEHAELILAFRRRDPIWASSVMSAHIRRAFHTYNDAFQEYLEQDPQAA